MKRLPMIRIQFAHLHLASLLLALALTSPVATAQISTWSGNGTDNNWTTSANWDTLPAAGSNLTFQGLQPSSVNNFASGTVFGRIFKSNATATDFTLSGNAITFGDTSGSGRGIEVASGAGNLTVNLDLIMPNTRDLRVTGGSLIFNGNISESGGTNRALTKSSTGTVTLNGTNTFTGNLSVQGGTLQINSLANAGVASAVGAGSSITLGTNTNTGSLIYTGSGDSSSNRTILIGSNVANATHTGGATVRNNSANGTLTFTGADFNLAQSLSDANRTLTLAGSNTGNNTVQGTIRNNSASGIVSLVKSDAGQWVLSGNNTHTGNTTISSGTLVAAHANALGSTNSGTTVAAGTTLALRGDITTASEALSITGTGVGSNGALRNLSGNNTYGGNITLAGNANIGADASSSLQLNGTMTGGSNTLTKVGAGTLKWGGGNAITTTGRVFVQEGVLDLNGYNQTIFGNNSLPLTLGGVAGGTPAIASGNGTLTLSADTGAQINYSAAGNPGGAVISGNLRYSAGNDNMLFQVGDSSATDEELIITAVISKAGTANAGSFYLNTGEGTLVLAGNNTFDPTAWQIRKGRVVLAADAMAGYGTLGTGSEVIQIGYGTSNQDGNATLLLKQGVTNARNFQTIALFDPGNTTYTRTLGGVHTSGSSQFTGNVTVNYNAQLAAEGASTVYFNGTISGTNATLSNIIKIGTGTVVLGGNNTYKGNTTVSAGALVINGDQTTANGDVIVASGATLGGNGILGGNITLNGTLSPGASVGNFTAAANVTLNDGAIYRWEVTDWTGSAGTGYDHIQVNGNLVGSGGNITLQIVQNSLVNFTESNKTFTIATAAGGITGDADVIIDNSTFTAGNGTWSVDRDGTSLFLYYTAPGGGGVTFAGWAAGYGVNASLTANNDTDKFTNGEEYAFDLDPTVKEYGNVLASTTSLSGGNVTMTLAFNGNRSKQDINYVVRRANNPGFTSNTVVGHWNGTANWTTSNATYFANETQSGAGDVKAINVNMSIPSASEPRQFLKVNIE